MIVPQTFAALLARVVALFRDPAAKEEQKTQFRALVAQLKTGGVALRAGASGLSVNGTAVAGVVVEPLLRRLELHGVEEIIIDGDPPAGQVFELIKVLADQPTDETVRSRLAATGVDRITVNTARMIARDEIVRSDTLEDIAALDAAWAPPPPVPPPPPPAAPPLPAPPAEPVAPAESLPLVEFTAVGAPVESAASAPPGDALAQLERNPRAANVAELLHALGREIEDAVRGRRAERAVRILAGIVRSEQMVPDAAQRRQYGITLKRTLTKAVLEALAHLVTVPAHHEDALRVLQRAGADGVEVLLDILVAAPTVTERQAIFTALSDMKEGTDQLVHMLDHNQWFVVRNVAELVGEMGLEDAVPALAKGLEHEDERVRKAVALALAKIGTGAAAEPLRRALRDKSAAVRIQAALGVGGRRSSALAMPLVVAMEEEEDAEVERELILALGRIGSADAVQALIKFAQPAGRLFGRKPTALRVAAVEALRLAATPAAVGMLQGLAQDSDKQVRIAAQEAVKDVKR